LLLLHFEGDRRNPVFDPLSPRVQGLSALSSDFDYFIPDDIEGFGPASERCLVTFARKLRSARTGSDNLS